MYTAPQKRIAAREIARHSPNLSKAVDSLKLEHEGFDKCNITTLRRFLRDSAFRSMLRKQEILLDKATAKGDFAAEVERARKQSMGREDLKRIASDQLDKLKKHALNGDFKASALCLNWAQFLAKLQGIDTGPASDTAPEDDA